MSIQNNNTVNIDNNGLTAGTSVNNSGATNNSPRLSLFAESVAAAQVQDIIDTLNKVIQESKKTESALNTLTLDFANAAASDALAAGLISGGVAFIGALGSAWTVGGYGSQLLNTTKAFNTLKTAQNTIGETEGLNALDSQIKDINTSLKTTGSGMMDDEGELQELQDMNGGANGLGKTMDPDVREGLVSQRDGLVAQKKSVEEQLNNAKSSFDTDMQTATGQGNKAFQQGATVQGFSKIGDIGSAGFSADQQQKMAGKDIANNMNSSQQSVENSANSGVGSALQANVFAAGTAASR